MSDSGKSSCGFGITASMYFLTVGFQNWDGSGVYHDPEISTEISKVAYSPPGPEPQGVKTYHQIMVNGISYTIQIQSTSIISGVAYDPARNEIVFTVQGQEAAPGSTTVTIPRPLSPWEDAILAYLDDVPCSRSWTSGMDRLVSLTHGQGGHTVRIALNSPRTATQITCDASPPATSKGLSILISGTLAPMVPDAQVIIETSDDSGNSWTLLTTTRTAASGEYSYEWRPIQAKTCLVRASWQGDLLHKGATSEARTVTIRESGDNLMLMAMVAVGLVVAAGVAAVPIIRRRKESRASV
jgi:hypothetical protein